MNSRHREQTVSSANALILNPDGPEEDRKMDHVVRLLTEVAQAQNLSTTSQSSLSELCKQLQIKSYKERATQAMIAAGVAPPDGIRPHTRPALCNPKQTSEVRGIAFPLGEIIISRVVDSWRSLAGLRGQESWHPDWDYPPSNQNKMNKMVPKPCVNMADYSFPPNKFLCAKPLKSEAAIGEKTSPASLPLSRLEEWENTISSSLGIINMVDIFSSSLNADMKAMWDCLDSYTENTLPPDLVNLHEERHRIQAEPKAEPEHSNISQLW